MKESGHLQEFINDRCETHYSYISSRQELYTEYLDWCFRKIRPLRAREFGPELEKLGFFYKRTSKARFFTGVRPKEQGGTIS